MNQNFFKRKMEDKDRKAVSYLPDLSKIVAQLTFAEAGVADLEELLTEAKEKRDELKKQVATKKKLKDEMFFQACFYRNLLKSEYKQSVEYLFNGAISPDQLFEALCEMRPVEKAKLKQAFEVRFIPQKEAYADACNRCQIGLPPAEQLEADARRAELQPEYERLAEYYKLL